MSSRKPTQKNLLETLPPFLRTDESVVKLADAMAQALAQRPEEIDRLRIYPDIFRLDEKLLDILAYDFKVDWWDYNYGLEEKRALLKSSFSVHRHLGTRGAVIKALASIYSGASVEEWFEYGGNPYGFKVLLRDKDMPVMIPAKEIRKAVDFYKSLRSHLDKIVLIIQALVRLEIGLWWQFGVRVRLSVWDMLEIRLDGSCSLDGGWILSSVWNRGPHFDRFALRHRKKIQPRIPAYMTVIEGMDFEHRKIPVLTRLAIWTCYSLFGLQTVRLDGSRKLDGDWKLGILFARGAAFSCFGVKHAKNVILRLPAGQKARWKLSGYTKDVPRLVTVTIQNTAAIFDRGGVLQKYAVHGTVNAVPCRTATLKQDSMWQLDGEQYLLDGERQLNADIIISDL